MYWIYYTKTDPLSWKDSIIIQFLRSKGVQIKIQAIVPGEDFETELAEHIQNKPDRLLLSSLFDKTKTDSDFFEFYVPIYMAQVCQESNLHFTYLTQDYLVETQTVVYIRKLLEMKQALYLNLWIIMNEDMTEKENGLVDFVNHPENYCIDGTYHVTVTADAFPVLYDAIMSQKTGGYELTNPTTIEYSRFLGLYCEYMSVKFPRVTEDITSTLCTHDDVDTTRLENEYFILPSYQAVQRLIKRVRKSSVFIQDVNLMTKCCVMVTGGFGFIGSNLVHYLYHQFPKCQIVNVDRLDYCSRRENLDDLLGSERVKCYEIDLCATEKVEEILRDHEVDYIFHLAAQSHVDNSFNNSLQFSRDNMYGTHSLLEASKNYGKILRFLHVSTDEIYGETLQLDPFTEDVLPNPTNPYAATKVGAEYIVKSYFHCFELPIVIVRGNNVYGPRQYPEKMIPKFITSVLQGDPCTVAGNGLMQRNFIFVEDVCRGLVKVMENGVIDQIYNIGSDDEKSVVGTARSIIQIMNGVDTDTKDHIVYVKDRYYNDFRYSINSEKIRKLGWQPKVNFEEGLMKTIQYYTENISLYNNKSDDEQ